MSDNHFKWATDIDILTDPISHGKDVMACYQGLLCDLATRLFDAERSLIYWRAYAVGCTLLLVFLAGYAAWGR